MTERKRASGFVLMDAAFTSDAKFVRLARKANDPLDYATSIGVWWILLADCRRAKSPIVDWDDYTEYAGPIEKLKAAKLLNEGGFDPEPFERWAPAYRSVSERTPGTKGDGEVRSGTKSTLPSGQVISGHLTSTGEVGGAGEGEPPMSSPPVFLGFPPKKPKKLTSEEIASYRRHALTSTDPLVKANARETLEKLGIAVEESA